MTESTIFSRESPSSRADSAVVFAYQRNALVAGHDAAADITANVVGRPAVAELYVLHVVVDAVVVDIVEV